MRTQRNIVPAEPVQANFILQSNSPKLIDDQVYLKKQKKNIHAIFSLFNDMPLEQSKKIAQFAT